MAKIKLCTGTTEEWEETKDILVLDEREIVVEIAKRDDGSEYTKLLQGDGKNGYEEIRTLFDQSAYEDALSETQADMRKVNEFSQSMTNAASAANTSATSAANAAALANSAAQACEGALDGMNTMVDTVTNTACVLTIEDGLLTIREAE